MRRNSVRAGYTVEAAGVMALVLFTVMILINQAFRIHGETARAFALHEKVEQDRHRIEHVKEREITMEAQTRDWSLEITAPVFRPEEMLRLWSLAEEAE